jgi:hypothetical protein
MYSIGIIYIDMINKITESEDFLNWGKILLAIASESNNLEDRRHH